MSCVIKEGYLEHLDAVPSLAAMFAGPRKIRVMPILMPSPGPGQVRVRLEGCGVSPVHLPAWEGRPWLEYPLTPGAPGHEGWGRIDAIGADVEGYAPGDRVALISQRAYAQHELVAADQILRLPPALDGHDFPGESLGQAMNIVRRAAICSGETVAVVGAGFLGMLLIRLASQAGARVIALSRRPYALNVARKQGAAATILSHDYREAARRVRALTDGSGCDCVIEAGGEQATLDLAGELTRHRGRLIIAGHHQDSPRFVNLTLWNQRGLDIVNAHESDPNARLAGMREAIAALVAGRLDPTPFYTHRMRLAELPMALQLLRERPEGFMKALLTL